MEHDYLPYSKVSRQWTPFSNVAEMMLVYVRHQGSPRGGDCDYLEPPLGGGIRGSTPEAKNRCKITL